LPLSGPARDRADGWADGYGEGLSYGLRRADMLAEALKGVLAHRPATLDPLNSAAWLWAESAYEIYKGGKRER